jgi:ApaG protein
MDRSISITEGVVVGVTPSFRDDVSDTRNNHYFFNYRISIENRNRHPVQLVHRDWFIFDSLNAPSHVSGEGVIGQQPVLEAGESYSYTSGCELHSEIGNMHGFYTFRNMETGQIFKVEIPVFDLVFPGRLN